MLKMNSTIEKIADQNLLEHEFKEALKDSEFKEIVECLKLERKELIKYTSSIEESACEYRNCKNCKNILGCQNKITGYAYLPSVKEEKLIFAYTPCRYQKKVLKQEKITNNIFLYNMPKELKQAKMKDVYVKDPKRINIIKWVTNFIENYPKEKKGLYLHGNFGCGKTYIIAAMFNELAKKNVKSAIIFWPDFLQELKASFNSYDFKEKLEQIKKVELLLIDDIGAENMTPWARDDILCPILQYRMQEEKPTFFTSNMNITELEKHLSLTKNDVDLLKAKRILERVKQLTQDIELIGENLRK